MSSRRDRGACLFVLQRADVAKRRVAARGVVEAVDVALDGVVGLRAGGEAHVVQALFLQAREEGLGDGVVVTVARVAHALRGLLGSEQLAVRVSGVQAAAIGMMDEPRGWVVGLQSALEGAQGQVGAEVVIERPADDTVAVQVEQDGQVAPALGRPHVGDVADPPAVWGVDVELLIE